jgi:hypothetical protein
VERDPSLGQAAQVVTVVMGAVVVEGAEQDTLGEVGATASGPRDTAVVGLAPGGGDVTAERSAGRLVDGHGPALRGPEEPVAATEVEDLGVAAEDGGDEGGRAGQAASLPRGAGRRGGGRPGSAAEP